MQEPKIQDMFAQLATQLSSITEELQNIRQENQTIQQDLQSLRTEHNTLRQEINSISSSSTSLDHNYDIGPLRQDRITKGSSRTHSRAVPYARNADSALSASLPDGRDAT